MERFEGTRVQGQHGSYEIRGLLATDYRNFDGEQCFRCGKVQYGGSHYHCGGCASPEETNMYGHWDSMTKTMTCSIPDELESANREAHRPL